MHTENRAIFAQKTPGERRISLYRKAYFVVVCLPVMFYVLSWAASSLGAFTGPGWAKFLLLYSWFIGITLVIASLGAGLAIVQHWVGLQESSTAYPTEVLRVKQD